MLYGGRKYTGIYARKPGAARTNVFITPAANKYPVKATASGTVYKPKFATVSYSRNIEKSTMIKRWWGE